MGKDVRFRHGEDADFDAELGIERRVHDYSQPLPELEHGTEAEADAPDLTPVKSPAPSQP